ncbi:uncharacterized protein LOC119163032 isoform X2 [Rhipicephalus microplus]|uniref:uncharacterized protein LOC119163032 isoform X2 n=1 Tax=Rhipicephalus microplus TaxID=6941 RepID=UPI003F6CC04D
MHCPVAAAPRSRDLRQPVMVGFLPNRCLQDPGQPTVIASSPAAASESSPNLCCPGQPYAHRALLNSPPSLGCITELQ